MTGIADDECARQRILTEELWTTWTQHGVTAGTKLRLHIAFIAPDQSSAECLLQCLAGQTDFQFECDEIKDGLWVVDSSNAVVEVSREIMLALSDRMSTIASSCGCCLDGFGAFLPWESAEAAERRQAVQPLTEATANAPGARLIGILLRFRNNRLGIDLQGSAHEILAEFRARGLQPSDVVQHSQTKIACRDVAEAIGAGFKIKGGAQALTWLKVLEAIEADDFASVVEALDEAPGILQTEDEAVPLSLCKASARGNADIVKLLLERGADPNCPADLGMTALHWAAAYGHSEVAAMLIEAGAHRGMRSWLLWTPAHVAYANGYKELACTLAGGTSVQPPDVSAKFVLDEMGCVGWDDRPWRSMLRKARATCKHLVTAPSGAFARLFRKDG